jgi:arylsulfatase A-like enzyme
MTVAVARPNVVYINSHDTGRYIQPYGHAVPTPRLQQLAEEGVLFRQAFCAAPTCSPSRAALLTGQSAHSSGVLGLIHRGFRLSDPGQHLLHILKAHGYATALAGVQHVFAADQVASAGYDFVDTNAGRAEITARDFIARASRDHPFYLEVGFFETHRARRGFSPDEQETALADQFDAEARYCRPPTPLPDTPEIRRDMATYKHSAARLDRKVGIVLDAIDAAGLRDNTLVISTTDHGLAFPKMKCSLTDHGIGVSLIVRGPGDSGFAGGRVVDALVSQMDLFPTVCDLAEIELPNWLQGRSLLPLVRGEADEINDAIFAEVTFHAAYEPKRAVRTKRYKYIRNYNNRNWPNLPNCDDSASKDALLALGWRDQPVPAEQLFDLVFDLNETNNLTGDPAHATTLADLRARLGAWMTRTNDPLLLPSLPVPADIRVNDADGLSPNEPVIPWEPPQTAKEVPPWTTG